MSYPISSSLRKAFHRASPVATSGHLPYFLSLLFLTFSTSPFRSSHRKCSIKQVVLKVLQYSRENTYVGMPAALLKRDFNTGVFLWLFLFTNSYRITFVFPSVLIFLVKKITKENVTPMKRARASN